VNRYSVEEFVNTTGQQDRGQGVFELENDRTLEINLEGLVWTKLGSMVAYAGDIRFEREGIAEGGLGKMLKRAVTGEGTRLTKAQGRGKLYLADYGKKVSILNLQGDTLLVNGNDVLAFEDSLEWDVTMLRRVAAMLGGGLFQVKFTGSGLVAITTHHDPLTLRVTPGNPVKTDPNATVAWSGGLETNLRTDVSMKTLLGRGSGESLQMEFTGDGFVVVQPYEEVHTTGTSG